MRVAGTAALAAQPERVRAVLGDPRRLVEALPNVSELEWDVDGEGALHATIRPATGLGEVPIRTVWRSAPGGAGSLGYRVEGRTDEHRLDFEVSLRLGENGQGGTAVAWTVSFQVTGTMRSATQRTIEAIVAAQAGIVLEAVSALARD